MKQRRIFSIPPPLEGDEDTLLVSFCIPDTHGWRSAATALLSQFDYGRAYDEDTGSILGALEVGKEIFGSMSMCNLDEINRSIRQLTAVIGGQAVDYTQPIPDQEDFSNVAFGLLPMFHEHLQSLGPIPKQGDTIMTSLQKLVEAEGYTGMTIDELVTEINGLQPTLFDRWKDYLEILSFMSDIFPGTTRVDIVGDFFQKLSTARFRHNLLTIQGYQATALRGIMRGIAPFDDDPEADEQSLLEKYGSIPWLGKAAVAILEPSPGGEAWLAATTLAQALASIYQKIVSAWGDWWDNWINKVGTPTPTDNVTSAISSLSGVIGGIDTSGGGATINPFLNLANILSDLAASISNMSIKCSFCGSSGGCNCDGIGGAGPTDNLPNPDDYTAGDDAPLGWDEPQDDVGTPEYDIRKCKMANLVHSTAQFVVNSLASKTAEIAAAKSLPAALALALAVTIVAATLGEISTPVPVLDGLIVGSAALALALASYLVSEAVVFGPLSAAMSAREQDLVCALYTSTSMAGARSAYTDVLVNEGVTSVAASFAGLIVSGQFATLLFLDVATLGIATDTALESYNGPVNCAECSGSVFFIGTYNGVICGEVISGSGLLDEVTIIESRSALAFGTMRQQIRCVSVNDQCLVFRFEVESLGSDTTVFQDGNDCNGQYYQILEQPFGSAFPSDITCRIRDAVGGLPDAATPYRLRVIPSLPA